jgi:YtkA-like
MTVQCRMSASRWASIRTSLLIVATSVAATFVSCRRADDQLTEWQRAKSGSVEVVLLSSHGVVRHGRDAIVIEFRSVGDGKLVDVGEPRASATMPMPGMPMFGSINLKPTEAPGRYTADMELEMAGTWRFNVQWQDAAGSSSVGFSSAVQ